MSRVLGIDPGAWLGWCVLDWDPARRVGRFIQGGVISVDEVGEEKAVALGSVPRPDRLAVERVERVLPTIGFQRGAAQQAQRLVDAAWLGGRIAGALRLPFVTVTAEAVRRHFVAPAGLVGKGKKMPDMDGVLLAVAEQKIDGWPEVIAGAGVAYRKTGADLLSTRLCHAVDAALVALYAAEKS